MKNIFILLIITLGAGVYGGTLLSNKLEEAGLDWGSTKNTISNMASSSEHGTHTMPDGTVMSNTSSTTLSHDMETMMMDMNKNLEAKNGVEFDKEFLKEMIVHHQGAIDMANQVLAKSKRPELIKLANDIITAQTNEINQMKAWQTEWFK